MVNPSWAEDSYYEGESEVVVKCVLTDCPCRQQRLDCQWEAAMATPGNACWHPDYREDWLLAAEAAELEEKLR